jgi:hypothetical protein
VNGAPFTAGVTNLETAMAKIRTTTPVKRYFIEVEGKMVLCTRYAPHDAYQGAHTWERKGGFITVTGGNGLGIVPQAYQTKVYTNRRI